MGGLSPAGFEPSPALVALRARAALRTALAGLVGAGLFAGHLVRGFAFAWFFGATGAFVGRRVLPCSAGARLVRFLPAPLFASARSIAVVQAFGVGLALARTGRLRRVLRLSFLVFGRLSRRLAARLIRLLGTGRTFVTFAALAGARVAFVFVRIAIVCVRILLVARCLPVWFRAWFGTRLVTLTRLTGIRILSAGRLRLLIFRGAVLGIALLGIAGRIGLVGRFLASTLLVGLLSPLALVPLLVLGLARGRLCPGGLGPVFVSPRLVLAGVIARLCIRGVVLAGLCVARTTLLSGFARRLIGRLTGGILRIGGLPTSLAGGFPRLIALLLLTLGAFVTGFACAVFAGALRTLLFGLALLLPRLLLTLFSLLIGLFGFALLAVARIVLLVGGLHDARRAIGRRFLIPGGRDRSPAVLTSCGVAGPSFGCCGSSEFCFCCDCSWSESEAPPAPLFCSSRCFRIRSIASLSFEPSFAAVLGSRRPCPVPFSPAPFSLLPFSPVLSSVARRLLVGTVGDPLLTGIALLAGIFFSASCLPPFSP